jgi:hypothetical protein
MPPFNNVLITGRDYQSDCSLHGTSVRKATGSCILNKLLLTCNPNNIFLPVIHSLSRTFNAYVNTNVITYMEQSLPVEAVAMSASQMSHISCNRNLTNTSIIARHPFLSCAKLIQSTSALPPSFSKTLPCYLSIQTWFPKMFLVSPVFRPEICKHFSFLSFVLYKPPISQDNILLILFGEQMVNVNWRHVAQDGNGWSTASREVFSLFG